MVFEKNPDKRYCEICNGPHMEEHGAYKLEQATFNLTGTGKVLPAVTLAAALVVIFVWTISYTGMDFAPNPGFLSYLNNLLP